MNVDRARELLTAELTGLDEQTRATQRRYLQLALDRLDEGSYGSCRMCGATIDAERLEVRPEAATCREHADTPVGA